MGQGIKGAKMKNRMIIKEVLGWCYLYLMSESGGTVISYTQIPRKMFEEMRYAGIKVAGEQE